MTKLNISLACTYTDRSAPILDGRIAIPGCRINAMPGETQDIFRRVLNDQAFDVAEMSMSSHIVATGRGDAAYVGIPVFLSRSFRHSSIYVRTDRGIERPEDLKGRTVGVEQFQQTVGLWLRGILGDRHGVGTRDIRWRSGGLEQPGGGERIALDLPAGIDLQALPAGGTLNGALESGELDAVITPRVPSCFKKRSAPVARLFSDPMQAEIEYFRATRIFPIMHVVVVRKSLVAEHAWLPAELFRAFAKAKEHALNELTLTNIPRVSLAWINDNAAQTRSVLGDKMWAYGFKESRAEVETMLRYAHADGLVAQPLEPEALFDPSTHGLADIP